MQYSRDILLSVQSNTSKVRRFVRSRIFRYKLHTGDLPDPSSVFVSERKWVLSIGLLNFRSIGNKSAPLVECIVLKAMDLFLAVETWHVSQDVSLSCTSLPGFLCLDVPRSFISSEKKRRRNRSFL